MAAHHQSWKQNSSWPFKVHKHVCVINKTYHRPISSGPYVWLFAKSFARHCYWSDLWCKLIYYLQKDRTWSSPFKCQYFKLLPLNWDLYKSRDKRFFSLWNHHKCLSSALFEYQCYGSTTIINILLFQCGDRVHQNLMSKVSSRPERVNGKI